MRSQAQQIALLKPMLIGVTSETNGINLEDTLELLCLNPALKDKPELSKAIADFRHDLWRFQQSTIPISKLLDSWVCGALFEFFKDFPLPYYEAHSHLTGSLAPLPGCDSGRMMGQRKCRPNARSLHAYST